MKNAPVLYTIVGAVGASFALMAAMISFEMSPLWMCITSVILSTSVGITLLVLGSMNENRIWRNWSISYGTRAYFEGTPPYPLCSIKNGYLWRPRFEIETSGYLFAYSMVISANHEGLHIRPKMWHMPLTIPWSDVEIHSFNKKLLLKRLSKGVAFVFKKTPAQRLRTTHFIAEKIIAVSEGKLSNPKELRGV